MYTICYINNLLLHVSNVSSIIVHSHSIRIPPEEYIYSSMICEFIMLLYAMLVRTLHQHSVR